MTTKINRRGRRVPLSVSEQSAFDAMLAEHESGRLDRAKAARIDEIQSEADQRIAASFGETDQVRLLTKQVRTLAGAVKRVRGEARGGGTDATLDALEAQLASVEAIRAAAATAVAAVTAATNEAAVAAVVVAWPQ